MTTIAETIEDIAKKLGVNPVLALAQAWQESGLNPNAEGDYTLNGQLVPKGTPGAVPTSFGLYQLHKGGELGNLSQTEAFDPTINATTALTEVAAVAKSNPNASPGEIAALAGRPSDPGQYAIDIDQLYTEIASGNPPAGFTQASGMTDAELKAASGGIATGSIGSVLGGNETGGFLHEMQDVMNLHAYDPGWMGVLNIPADTANLGLTIVARLGAVVLGLGMILGGVVILVMDFTKMLNKTTDSANSILAPIERGQRILQTPERLSQSERRLAISEQRSTAPPSRETTFEARMAALRLSFERENRIRRTRGESELNWDDFVGASSA